MYTGQVIPQIVSTLQVIAFFLVTHPSWCNKKQNCCCSLQYQGRISRTCQFSISVPNMLKLITTLFFIISFRVHIATICLLIRSINLVDIFTKPPSPGYFHELVSKLKLISIHPTHGGRLLKYKLTKRALGLLYCISIA